MEQFAEFLSNLKDHFYLCKNVTESVFRAAGQMPERLRKRLEDICFVLEQEDTVPTGSVESFPGHLKLLRIFTVQCRSAVQYGSGKTGAESVFIRNVTELRRDVQEECYQRAQAMHLFAGMGIVTALPMLFLPLFRLFGAATMEELAQFYEGKDGETIRWVFAGITACSYGLILLVRQNDKRVYRRPVVIQYLFSETIFHRLAERTKGTKAELTGRKALKMAGIDGNGLQYWTVCILSGVLCSFVMLWRGDGVSFGKGMLLFCFGLLFGTGLAMGFYRYLGYLRRLGMVGEVMNLQSMILLLLNVPNITIMEVLSVLGEGAEVFREKLVHCSDVYGAEEEEALRALCEQEEHPEFRRLAGCILAGEQVGLKAAFSELAFDRSFFRKQLRLDREQEQKKKAANAQVIAFLPMLFLLFAYLIFPFLSVSLCQMREIFKEMDQIRFF